jgi:hypothetical protein
LLDRNTSRTSAVAELHLFVLRLEHALQRGLDLVDRLVDDRVVPHVDAFALGQLAYPLGGLDVEADDHGVVDRGQVDVVLGDRTDTAVDDAQLDLVAHLDLEQRIFERLDRTGHVALEDEVERLDLASRERLVEVLQADPLARTGEQRLAVGRLALLGDLPRGAVVGGHQEGVAGAGYRGEPEHHDRPRRACALHVLAVLVEHGPHPAVCVPATIESPTCSVPDCTSTVATEPRPLSRWPSMANPTRVLSPRWREGRARRPR